MNYNDIFEHIIDTDVHVTTEEKEKWNNMDVNVDWDKITNKPTTLAGYGITDVYTKDEIQDNTLNKFKAINGKVLVDTGFNLGLKDGDNLISYNYGTSGAPTLKLGVNAYISSYMSNMDIVAPTQLMLKTDNLNLKTKLLSLQGSYGNFSVDVSDNKGNNKLYASIPAEFTDIVKAPRLNIYSGNNTVLEGALWNSTYNINGTIKDGLHLSHENGKYLALAYKNASTGIYNSYMIFDVEGVLKNDSDGDDWGPVRFEQNVFFRHGLKIGGGEDITLAGKGVNTRITALENAISQGTGMVECNNVLNKPSTFTPSIHSHAISDITSLQSALDGKAASNHTHNYLPLSGGTMDPNAELTFANAKGLYGKDSKGVAQRLVVIGADDCCYLGGVNLHTYIRSSDCPQYLDSSGNKYNIYHSGNFNPTNYLPLTGGTLTGDITLSNSKAIKGKNNSGTAQDLIKLGTYATSSGSTQATIVGNSNYPIISLGSLYEGNYRVLNSNNFTNYCPSISDLDNYLPLSGGNLTGDLVLNAASEQHLTFNNCSKSKLQTYFYKGNSTDSTTILGLWDPTNKEPIWKVNNDWTFEVGKQTTFWKKVILNNAMQMSGKTTAGDVRTMCVVGADNAMYLSDPNIHTYIRSSDCPQYLDSSGKKYNIYHSGNFTPSDYMPWTYTNIKTTKATNNFRKLIRGSADKGGFLQSFRKNDETDWCMPIYGSGVAWGQDDTHGMIYTHSFEPKAYIAGGSANKLNWAKQLAFTEDLANYALLNHSHMQISSQGRKAPMTGRNAISGIYCYSTSGGDSTGSTMPTGYCVVIGFGDGTGGSAEIAISYTGNGMWFRYLRDYQDNWSSWTRLK